MPNPYARESKAQTGGILRVKLISDQNGVFSSCESQQEGAVNVQDSRSGF